MQQLLVKCLSSGLHACEFASESSHMCIIDGGEFCPSKEYSAERAPDIPKKHPSKWDSLKERKTAIKASLQQDALTLPWMPPRPPFTFNLVPFSLSLTLSLSLSSCPFPSLLLSRVFLSQSKRASLRLHELRVENVITMILGYPSYVHCSREARKIVKGRVNFDKSPK